MAVAESFCRLFVETAPWLLLGLLVAGLMKSLVPTKWMARALGRPGFGSVVRAAVIGAPLPLCSCGVLPAAIGLKRQGASNGATVSFLISTPANGADSIAVSWALLGPLMTGARIVSASASALIAGLLADTRASAPAENAAAPT